MQTVLITLNGSDLESLIRKTIEDTLSKVKQNPEPQPEYNRLLNIQEVCSLLKVSKPTLHTWKREGRLPYHRMGAKVYFKEKEVIEAMKGVKVRGRK
jgi:excisionase family DNA binding protein